MAVLIRRAQSVGGRVLPVAHIVTGLDVGVEALLVQGGDAAYLAPAGSQPSAVVQALLAAAVNVTVFPANGQPVALVGAPALTIGGALPTAATVGVAYAGSVAANGGQPAYTFSVAGGALPAGLSLNPNSGSVTGTPTTAATSSAIVIRVTDALGATADLAAFAIVVSAAASAPPPPPPPPPTGPDTRPRYGLGSATAGVADPATLFAAMAATGSNGGVAGTFTIVPTAGQYGWFACLASASVAGVTFTEPAGTGGWQGASSPGNNFSDDGSSPNTSTVTAVIAGSTWRFFRMSYAGAGADFTTS